MAQAGGQISQEDVRQLVADAYTDPVLFCRFFLSDWFPTPMPWLHRGALALLTGKVDFLCNFGEEVWINSQGKEQYFEWTEEQLDKLIRNFVVAVDPQDLDSPTIPIFTYDREQQVVHMLGSRKVLMMFPRGFSKTTLTNAANLYGILYGESSFPVYTAETQTHAERQLANIKFQLESNERILMCFGTQKPEQRSGLQWTQDIIQTLSGVVVAARGRGGQIRGMNVNAKRPDRIVVDDVESKESTETPEQRMKTLDWFLGDLLPALSETNPDEKIIMLATLLHNEALAQRNRMDPDWTALVFGVLDVDGQPIWPYKLDAAKIEQKKMAFARMGRLKLFYMEYHNKIRSEDTQDFKASYFIHRPVTLADCEHRALVIDPAISASKKSDFCAFAVVGMSTSGQLVVFHADGEVGLSPREQVNQYFALHKKYGTTKNGVESIAYQAALIHLLREEMFRRHMYFEITAIGHHSQKKEDRIRGILQPRYAAGYVVHTRPFPLLETQLQDFPNGKRDVPDALAMAIALLDPYAAQAADPEKDLGQDEYEPMVIKYSSP